jgi:hypothetical protein
MNRRIQKVQNMDPIDVWIRLADGPVPAFAFNVDPTDTISSLRQLVAVCEELDESHMRLASPTGVDLLPETPLNEIITSEESPLTFWVEAPPPPRALVACRRPSVTFVLEDDGLTFTAEQYGEVLWTVSHTRDLFDRIHRFGFLQGWFKTDGVPDQAVMIPTEILDTYLRTVMNSSLNEFMDTVQSALPRPRYVSRTELILTEMWENAVRKMPLRERELIYSVTRLKVRFTEGAQIVALAEGNIERIAEMTQICVLQRNDMEIPFFVSDLKSS